MGLQSIARDAFATIQTLVADSVVAVIIGAQTGNGVKSTLSSVGDLSNDGDTGTTSGVVRVSVADFSEPSRGQRINVDGDDVFVLQARIDAVDATMAIEYSKQQPAEFDA